MNAAATTMRLPPVLDLGAAEGFLGAIQERVRAGGMIRLDAGGVERLTLPCLQIILSALRSHRGMAVDNPSPAFAAAFADLGVDWRAEETAAPEPVAEPPTPAAAAEPAHQEVREPSMAKRILTIDDSKTMRDMLRLTLTGAGFEVLQASDGIEGLEVLGREAVDVVITDINMPRLDGFGVIKQLRSIPDFKTPILVLTTESEAEKKNIGRESGATGWLVKPFDPDRLVATIHKVSP